MNDEQRQAELDSLQWQIEGLRRELKQSDFTYGPEQRQQLSRKLADLEARVQEWRRP